MIACILFDKSTFTIQGPKNHRIVDCRELPHWILPEEINVWIGNLENRIIGPTYFEGNLTKNKSFTERAY